MKKFKIFDIHQHIGSLDIGGGEGGSNIWKSDEDYAKRVELLDKFGIQGAAIMPSSQYLRPNGISDTCAMNDLVAEYRNRYRDRFPVAMGTVEPLNGEDAGIREIRRIVEKLRLNGVVWHPKAQRSSLAPSLSRHFY